MKDNVGNALRAENYMTNKEILMDIEWKNKTCEKCVYKCNWADGIIICRRFPPCSDRKYVRIGNCQAACAEYKESSK